MSLVPSTWSIICLRQSSFFRFFGFFRSRIDLATDSRFILFFFVEVMRDNPTLSCHDLTVG